MFVEAEVDVYLRARSTSTGCGSCERDRSECVSRLFCTFSSSTAVSRHFIDCKDMHDITELLDDVGAQGHMSRCIFCALCTGMSQRKQAQHRMNFSGCLCSGIGHASCSSILAQHIKD